MLALALAVAAAWLWRLSRDTDALASQLVADVLAVPRTFERPSHLDVPVPGLFADGVAPELEALGTLLAKWKALDADAVQEACTQVRDGEKAWAELPAPCLSQLDEGSLVALRTLGAGRREKAGMPEGQAALAAPEGPGSDGLVRLQHAQRIAALEVRRRLAEGRPDDAAALCVDALAFSRDLGWGTGLIGAMVSVATTQMVKTPCEEAMAEASAQAQADAAVSLRRVAEGLRPFEHAMREEALYSPLLAFGSLLSDEHRAQLPPGALAIVDGSDIPGADNVAARAVMRDAWTRMAPMHQALASAMALPPAERAARLDALAAEASESLNPIVRMGMPNFGKFAERADAQRAVLEGLIRVSTPRTSSLEVTGVVRLELRGVQLEAADGGLWVLDDSRDALWDAFADRAVVVRGERWRPEGQALLAEHLRPVSWRLVDGEASPAGTFVEVGPAEDLRGVFEERAWPKRSKLQGERSLWFVGGDGADLPVANRPEGVRAGAEVTVGARRLTYPARVAHVGDGTALWVLEVRAQPSQ